MIRLSRFTLLLILMFAAALILIRLGSGGSDTSRFSLLFTDPDGTPCQRPCLFGIPIGAVTITRAIAMRDAHLLTLRQFSAQPVFAVGFSVVSDGDSTIDGIQTDFGLRDMLPFATFGEAIRALGAPTYVEYGSSSRCFSLVFVPDQIIVTNFRDTGCPPDQFEADDGVYQVFVFSSSRMAEYMRRYLVLTPWRGFGNARQYVSP